jgi:transmembrane sensor
MAPSRVLTIMTEKQVEELIQRYAEGIASDEEKRQLDDWYRFSSMSEVEWLSANPKEEEQVYHRMLQRMKKEIAARRTNVFQFPMLKVAALFLLVIGGGLLVLWYKNAYSHYYITLTNPSGKIQVVNLPDGSQAWLNAASTLRYRK